MGDVMIQILTIFLKGFLIGFGKMLPGVSGGMIAMMLKVYEKGLSSIAHFFEDIKNNSFFLGNIGIGIFIAIILSSKVILNLLKIHYLPTILFFIGLMLGGIPSIYRSIKKTKRSYFLIFLSFSVMFLFSIFKMQNEISLSGFQGFITLVFIGIIDAGTMVIPGVSGTAILMILGCYHLIIGSISKLTSVSSFFLELPILFPFCLGLLIGILLFVKLLDYLFINHKNGMYSIILGFASASIVILFIDTLQTNYFIKEIIIGLFLFLIGSVISYFLDKMV